MNLKMLAKFFLPIVIIFTVVELNKKNLSLQLEDIKKTLIKERSNANTKIIINYDNDLKSYIILKNINSNDTRNAEYRFFNIYDKKIKIAEFSDNLIFSNNTLTAKSYTRYENELIEDYKISKSLNFDAKAFIDQEFIVKDISKKDQFKINIKLINTLLFFILFFSYIFLNFLNKNLVSTKTGIIRPIFVCLIILIYSFLIFNNSLNIYRHEFEILGSLIAGLFFFKVYVNE